VIVTNLDAEPADPSASTIPGWTQVSTTRVKPYRLLWAGACRAAQRTRDTLTWLGLRAVAVSLRLSWRLDVTVGVDAEVTAADPDSARTALLRFLHDTARVVAVTPGPGGIGWRELGGVPVEQIGGIVAGPDDLADLEDPEDPEDREDPPAIWTVSTVVTATIMVSGRDAALVHGCYFDGYSYGDLTPYTEPWPISRLITDHGRIRRTLVRRPVR
jgi:hypothetical protein